MKRPLSDNLVIWTLTYCSLRGSIRDENTLLGPFSKIPKTKNKHSSVWSVDVCRSMTMVIIISATSVITILTNITVCRRNVHRSHKHMWMWMYNAWCISKISSLIYSIVSHPCTHQSKIAKDTNWMKINWKKHKNSARMFHRMKWFIDESNSLFHLNTWIFERMEHCLCGRHYAVISLAPHKNHISCKTGAGK